MNAAARPWIGLVFKCLAVLALVFAFIFFMNMMNEQSKIDHYRQDGYVSRAIVYDTAEGEVTNRTSGIGRRSSGSTQSYDVYYLLVYLSDDRSVVYADYPDKVSEAKLPTADKLTGDRLKDDKFSHIMKVTKERFDATKIGDRFVVIDRIYSGEDPEFYETIRDFDQSIYYPRIAIALALTLLFWLIGRRISNASARRGLADVARIPGIVP